MWRNVTCVGSQNVLISQSIRGHFRTIKVSQSVQHSKIAGVLQCPRSFWDVRTLWDTSDVNSGQWTSVYVWWHTLQGWYEGVKTLLRHAANPTLADKCGRTALHSATYPQDVKWANWHRMSSAKTRKTTWAGVTRWRWSHKCFEYLSVMTWTLLQDSGVDCSESVECRLQCRR